MATNKGQYNLIKSKEKPGYWVCTDTYNGVICTFRHKQFNDDQEFTMANNFNPANYQRLAAIGRLMGDWLKTNHYDKVI